MRMGFRDTPMPARHPGSCLAYPPRRVLLAGFWGAKPPTPQNARGRGMDAAGILTSAALAREGFRTEAGVDVASGASFCVTRC